MVFHDTPRTPETSIFLAETLALLRQPLPDLLIRDAVAREISPPTQVSFVPSDDVSPSACWAKSAQYLLLFCDGIDSLATGTGTWAGYIGGAFAAVNNPTNDYFVAAAQKVLAAMPPTYVTHAFKLIFCGWSLGGCVAMQVALAGIDSGLWTMPDIATFGSPRIGGLSTARRFNLQKITRWMTDTDPIPSVPPRVADMPILPMVYGIRATLRMGNFVHAPGGVSISPDGVFTDTETAPLAATNFPLGVGAWLLGSDAASGSPHQLGSYATRLRAWVAAHPDNNNPQRISTPIETTGQVSKARLSQAQAASERALFVNGAQQEKPAAKIPKELLFRAVRLNRLWYVLMGEQIVAIAPRKIRARGIANAGNDFLRRNLRQGYVNVPGMLHALEGWFASAEDAGSGITPTISSSLP